MTNDPLPEPLPGDTARLDQLGAHWREQPPEARQDVLDAAAALRAAPTEQAAAGLLDALRRAGLDMPGEQG